MAAQRPASLPSPLQHLLAIFYQVRVGARDLHVLSKFQTTTTRIRWGKIIKEATSLHRKVVGVQNELPKEVVEAGTVDFRH